MSKWFQWAVGAFGLAILTVCGFALKAYNEDLVAQEVEARVEPIEQQQAQFDATLNAVLFQQRLAEDREATNECEDDGREDCEYESDWRWSTYYPWADCASQFKEPKQRDEACGEQPKYERPE